MEDFLLVVILIVLFIRWIVLSGKMSAIERRIQEVAGDRSAEARLTQRVNALEQELKWLRAVHPPEAPPEPAVQTIPKPEPKLQPKAAAAQPPPLPVTRNFCGLCGRELPSPSAVCECRTIASMPADPTPLPETATERPHVEKPADVPVPVFSMATLEPSRPAFSQRMRESMKGEEWEAVVGGSWLNKLGVFLVVIGIASLLGYSFTKIGPSGRIAIGLGVSISMLVGGFLLEKRARYKIFARGLLGGGWAALYFTTYAMHAVDAAKIIYGPVPAVVLLLMVAAGMIVHSLRYRSQTVTGLAYFVAFVTLTPAIAPATATTLSVIALVPLAASLLYIAYRFSWSEIALLGLLATYGTCASRGDSGAPLWTAQTVFCIFWLLFEGFDLLRAKRRGEYSAWEVSILPLNAIAFIGLSYIKWSGAAPQHLYALAAGIGTVYLVSTAFRCLLRPPSSFATEAGTLERAFSGGYEGPLSLTAGLTVAAIFLRFQGATAQLGLLAEAELLFVAGLFFREAYPRHLASVLFAGSLGKLLAADLPAGGTTTIANFTVQSWTPISLLTALLFYVNRALRSADLFYGYAGSAVVALVLGFETPERFVGLSWFVLAAILFAFGWLRHLSDFRIQGYLLAGLGFGGVSVHQVRVATGEAPALRHPWISLGCAAALGYAGTLCGLRSAVDRLNEWERKGLRLAGSWTATVGLVALVWRVAPGDYLGVAWMALTIPLLELGLHGIPDDFRAQSYVVAALGAARVFAFNLIPITDDGPLEKRLMMVWAAIISYAIASRIYVARKDIVLTTERHRVFDLSSTAGTLFLLISLWALLPTVVIGPAWAVVALLLMEVGFALDLPSLRLHGHLTAAASVGRLFFANFTGLGRLGVVTHRVLTVVPVIIAQYYQWSRQSADDSRLRDWERPLARIYLYAGAVLAVVLMRFEFGRVLAVTGWAAFSLGLLFLGRRWNNIDLRWQSYVLAGLAFWRSWNTNFNAPDSLAGIPGRIATGAFVIACLYVAQLLLPRKAGEITGIERHARTYFSVLSAVLLAALLYYEVSGSMLTVAWGIEGVALLIVGFPLNDRVQRLSGLTLFLVCILKLFVYDLRHLETMYRIVSFIVLGLMLVSVSWIYTRFRDRIQRYL